MKSLVNGFLFIFALLIKNETMDIKNIIRISFEGAILMPDNGKNKGAIHANRSRNFVEKLRKNILNEYKDDDTIRAFSKYNKANKKEFGLNELLYDILVCKTDKVQSGRRKKSMTFVTKSLWQIESEFSKNPVQAVYDFNKLVIGASENKLFIAPNIEYYNDFLNPLSKLANLCNSKTYIAFIPHPKDWTKTLNLNEKICCFEFDEV